ncbi:MAG: asparagine synthase (glutamine-hydrolyzing) [Gemmatimonadaceae bacterium]|nr:asparagine synthase (glutamine-hydrolyzing) [Gemmatimonadaceae bacterium]
MCGIAGFWTPHIVRASMRPTLEAMMDRLHHRGPDDAGTWCDDTCGVALGHRRLSIVDLSPLGHQPMTSNSARYQIVFNGEIYNHRALRRSLERDGIPFRGHSDTETLLALIERDGLGPAIAQCHGMFAIALLDQQLRALHLIRDRFGEKPLYIARCGEGIAFASELGALRAHPECPHEVSPDALALYLRHGYVPAPYSILTNIEKLEPATIVTFEQAAWDARTTVRYWDIRACAAEGQATPVLRSDDQSVDALDTLMRSVVGDQMVADVPIGAFLSGGVDSSLVTALMQAQSRRKVRSFSIGFREDGFNEAPFAEEVAAHLGTDHTTMYVSAQDALDVIPRLPSIYSEPFADSSQVPSVLLAALAKRHVTVALSGDGADELFGGYDRYQFAQQSWERLERVPLALRRAARRTVMSMSPDTWNATLGPLGLQARGVTGDRLHKVAELFDSADASSFYRGLLSSWRTPGQVVTTASDLPTALMQPVPRSKGGLLPELMLRDQVSYLPDDILVKVDRAAMAASLESRAPFLDHRVAELAWTLRPDQWRRGGSAKWIVKQLLYRYVPRAIVERPKQGFGIPLAAWLRGPLRPWAEELLSPAALRDAGLLNAVPIRRAWDEHVSGSRNMAPSLWFILMFQAWRRT